MLHLRRRHLKECKHRDSTFLKCKCPLWVVGNLDGKFLRKSLDTRNLERAEMLRREIEAGDRRVDGVSVKEAVQRFLADAEARKLKEPTLRKYKQIMGEFKVSFDGRALRSLSVDDLRVLRESWKLSSSSARKRIELLRGFFSFCVSSGWIALNPAKGLKSPRIEHIPTQPFAENEWGNVLTAIQVLRDIHPQIPSSTQRSLKAIILLLRYSGLRISDAVSLKRERIDKDGRLFVHAIKNQKPVWLPLPEFVVKAIDEIDGGDGLLFWNRVCKLKTCITEYQERLKKVSKIAGVEGRGFAHRCRASFSVDLLNKGVPLEMVAMILGNTARVVELHYASFVQSRQMSLEAAVKQTWAS